VRCTAPLTSVALSGVHHRRTDRVYTEDGVVSSELGLRDTNGILRQPSVRPERTSAGLGWDRQYLSVQREHAYRGSFEAAGTHLNRPGESGDSSP
jgi:hypothetical protein